MRTDSSTPLTTRFLARLVFLLVGIFLSANFSMAADKIKFDYLSLNRSVAYLGEEITVSYIIEVPKQHRGKTAQLRFYLDKKVIGEQELSGFDDAGTLKSEFKFKAKPQGRYQLRAVLTVAGVEAPQIEEQRQLAILSLPGGVTEDQAAGAATKSDSGELLPDITPVKLDVDNPSPRAGDRVIISTTIANNGTARANNVKLRVFVDGLPLGEDVNISLDTGKQTTIQSPYTPSREGQKDILVMINPDSEVKELSGRNNIISRLVIVRAQGSKPVAVTKQPKTVTKKAQKKPVTQTKPAPKPSTTKQAVAVADKTTPEPRPNLVTYIETINGVHYTNHNRLYVFVSNTNKRGKSETFELGVRKQQASGSDVWLVRQTVKNLAPGTTSRIAIKWPDKYATGDQVYIAVADIDRDSPVSPNNDKQSRPFRVVSVNRSEKAVSAPAPAPAPALAPTPEKPKTTVVAGLPTAEIIITQPREKEVLPADGKATIRWKTVGNVGKRVKIAILDTRTGRMMLSTATENDGAFYADLSALPTAEYTLMISAADSSAKARKTRFKIRRPKKIENITLSSPLAGGSWRGKQVMPIKWPANNEGLNDLFYNFDLIEEKTSNKHRININPVAANFGLYNWTVPDDGSVFGNYKLEVTSSDGTSVALVNGLEFLPSFVAYDAVDFDPQKPNNIKVDLGLDKLGFEGPYFKFVVRNNGPYELGAGLTIGYSFKTYFVRHVPIRTRDDLVICSNNFLARMPVGTEQTVWLGKDPDCGAGTRSQDEKFVYAVTRISLPNSIELNFTGDKKSNNMLKYYW